MINPITFDSYDTALTRENSHSPSPVYSTLLNSALLPITPSQRIPPRRYCNPLDTIYQHPIPFKISPTYTSPELTFDRFEQSVRDQSSTDPNHHAGWYDDLDCMKMAPIVDLCASFSACVPTGAMSWERTREQHWDVVRNGVPQDRDLDQKNSTEKETNGGQDKDQGQKERKKEGQSHGLDQNQGMSQRVDTESRQKRGRGRPPGSMNKCKYCRTHKLSGCIRNGSHSCSNCVGKRDKRACDGFGAEEPGKKKVGRPRKVCDRCYTFDKKHSHCDRNLLSKNSIYPCSRCSRLNEPCYPLPPDYYIPLVPNIGDKVAGEIQAEERPNLRQVSPSKSGPHNSPPVQNEVDADTLETASPSTDGSNRSQIPQNTPITSSSSVYTSCDLNESEDACPAAQTRTYKGQQCHNCIKFADICDRYQPCGACINTSSRAKCLSARPVNWEMIDLTEDLSEEDNTEARKIERILCRFLD